MRYEVTEEPSEGVDGGRWSHTPALGIYHAVTDAHGNIVVPEDVIRTVLARTAGDPIEMSTEMERVLGQAWDDELESFRYAGDGAPVRWLTKVGCARPHRPRGDAPSACRRGGAAPGGRREDGSVMSSGSRQAGGCSVARCHGANRGSTPAAQVRSPASRRPR